MAGFEDKCIPYEMKANLIKVVDYEGKNVMPGDTLSQTVKVETLAGNSYDYHIYLYARQHSSEEPENLNPQAMAPLSREDEDAPNTDPGQQDASFWEQLTLTVTIDGKIVNLMEAGEGTVGVYLGRFNKSDDSNDIKVLFRQNATWQGLYKCFALHRRTKSLE